MPSQSSDIQVHADVRYCLKSAMVDKGLVAKPADVKDDTVPKKLPPKPDRGAWGVTLAEFAAQLRELKPDYAAYAHRPIYTVETFGEKMAANYTYLAGKVKLQTGGRA